MKANLTILAIALLSSCSGQDDPIETSAQKQMVSTGSVEAVTQSNEPSHWSEVCPSCGQTTNHYAYSFDDLDYAFLSWFFDQPEVDDLRLYHRAPHGPTPACSSRYGKDLHLDYLQKKMPALRHDTFRSFLDRNSEIAVHRITDFKATNGRSVEIVTERKSREWLRQLSRVGQSADASQLLVYTGQIFLLYSKTEDNWEREDSLSVWIP